MADQNNSTSASSWRIEDIRVHGEECQRGQYGDIGMGEMQVRPEMTPGGNIIYRAWSAKRGMIGEGARGKAFRSFASAQKAVERAHFPPAPDPTQ